MQMITITPAEPVNTALFAELAEEMDRFYGASKPEPLELRVRQINEALFNDPPSAYALLAWDEGQLAGFASYSFLWPAAGLTRSLYLKELYVIETARQKGIGKLLMQRLYEIAAENGCSRVEWTTDRDNPDAQRFYAELGVPVRESKLFYRIESDELRRRTGYTPLSLSLLTLSATP
jgi:GNAT superfamily N-acetyltransferase